MFRLLSVLTIAPHTGGAASGYECPEVEDPHSLAPGQGFRDRLEDVIDGVPGRRPSDPGRVGYTAHYLRPVHPFSTSVAGFF